MLLQVSKELGQPVEFTLQAYDPDQCSEVAIGDVGLSFNMELSAPSRVDSLGAEEAPKSVQRTFTWPAYYFDETGAKVDTTNAGLDQRDQFSVVCFYTSDKYLTTVHPFHCVEITLVQVCHLCVSTCVLDTHSDLVWSSMALLGNVASVIVGNAYV